MKPPPLVLKAARAALSAVRRSSGEPVEPVVRSEMEPVFGDLGHVRLERGPSAEEVTTALSADAVTLGHRVFLSRGAPGSHTVRGRALLAHELTHVAQAEQESGRGRSPVESLMVGRRVHAATFPQEPESGEVVDEETLAEVAAMMMRAPVGRPAPEATPPATARITGVTPGAPEEQATKTDMDALVVQVYEIIKRKLSAEAERLPC